MTKRPVGDDRRATPDFLVKAMETGDFMRALSELFKNANDAGATSIRITSADKSMFRIVDNGWGMDAKRQAAFLKAGFSTNNGSGKFGSGSSMFPFSFKCNVTVKTVSASDPRKVYIATFTYMQQAEYWLNQCDIEWRAVPKNVTNWPYEHPTGVELTYVFDDPKLSRIFRTAALRSRLTARLGIGIVESDMIVPDGQRLASKEYVEGTRPYQCRLRIPGSDDVTVELYRITKPRLGYALWMSDGPISEVSFRDEVFNKLVGTREKVPPFMLHKEVCGQIIAPFLKDHAMNNRSEYKELDDDERWRVLLRQLAAKQHEIAKVLNLRLEQSDEKDAAGQAEVLALLDRIDSSYNRNNTRPPAGDGKGGGKGRTKTSDSGAKSPYFELNRKEFEVGEVIEATLRVPGGGVDRYEIYDGDARAKTFEKMKGGKISLRAASLGTGKLIAIHKQTGASVQVTYEIIQERWFQLEAPQEVATGERAVLTAVNADKVLEEGDHLEWKIEQGHGELMPGPRTNTQVFVSNDLGYSEIIVYPARKPEVADGRSILVTRPSDGKTRAFCIRDKFFLIRFDGSTQVVQFNKPVTIMKSTVGPHRMTLTPTHPVYREALKDGTLSTVLILCMAAQFAYQFYDGDAQDDEVRHWEIDELAGEIAAEIRGIQ